MWVPGRSFSPDPQSTDSLILGFPVSKILKSKCLLLMSHPSYSILLGHPKWPKINVKGSRLQRMRTQIHLMESERLIIEKVVWVQLQSLPSQVVILIVGKALISHHWPPLTGQNFEFLLNLRPSSDLYSCYNWATIDLKDPWFRELIIRKEPLKAKESKEIGDNFETCIIIASRIYCMISVYQSQM